MLIYISGPFTLGDQIVNVRNACLVGDEILKLGHWPVVPHLTAFWHAITPKSWQEWLDIDLAILNKCDALLRLPGESKGADAEVRKAQELGLKVYFDLSEVPDGRGNNR